MEDKDYLKLVHHKVMRKVVEKMEDLADEDYLNSQDLDDLKDCAEILCKLTALDK